MTQFNPTNGRYLSSIVCTSENVYLIISNVRNKRSGRYLKNPMVLVGRVVKHRYNSSAPVVQAIEEWIDTVDFQDVFVKATSFPPEVIWDGDGFAIDFGAAPEEMLGKVFSLPLAALLYQTSIFKNVEDDGDLAEFL